MQHVTLLLTPWYVPQRILRWQDAITMVFLEKADIVANYSSVVRSPSFEMPLPAVLRSKRAPARLRRGVAFTRTNVFGRDGYRCQYCGGRFDTRRLSYDHVIPRSAGGRTEWTNIVTACIPCNQRKGHLTCDDAGMWPLSQPVRPQTLPLFLPHLDTHQTPPEWHDFLVPNT